MTVFIRKVNSIKINKKVVKVFEVIGWGLNKSAQPTYSGKRKETFFRKFPFLPQENFASPSLSPREFFYDFDGYALDGEVAADHTQFF